MPVTDTWDWPFLYYAGTVILKMSPGMFWKTTPRKLGLLMEVHIEVNKSDNKTKRPTGYIDQVI